MQDKELKELYWRNVHLVDQMERLVDELRSQNSYVFTKSFQSIFPQTNQFLEKFVANYSDFEMAGIPWDINYLIHILEDIESAQKEQDWVLLGDLYELQMIPACLDIQNTIRSMEENLGGGECFQQNLEALREKNPELYEELKKLHKAKTEGKVLQAGKREYRVEPTNIGAYTLAVSENGHSWYLHSNRNPYAEARQFISRVYRKEQEKVLVFGWGMGYHVQALYNRNPNLDILVYEQDLNVIYYSLLYINRSSLLQGTQLQWDSEYTQLRKLLGERELILFRPELRQIENLQIKEQLQMIAAKQDSMDAHRDLFYRNFKQNVACCDAYADDISDQIKGKRVVVVAAGPSLDNNIDQLKNCPIDVVVIAVGTVFRLLCQKGIRVDYVIFLDSCIYHQIRGMECNDTPVIVAATADGRVAKNYHGTTYLACQKGYDLAEDYAREHGGRLYETGGSVVTLALDLCIRMKAKSIAFIGLDLAYYDNRAHATGTGKETYNGYEFQKVEGIHGEMLNTSQVFNTYRLWLEERIKKADVTMEVYDATENGAKKKGFIVTTLAEYLSE